MSKLIFFLLSFCNTIFAQEFNRKQSDTLDIPIGKIKELEVVYDCFDCRQTYSGGISVYYKNKSWKHLLLNQKIADFYVSEVSLLKIKNNYFIYVNSDHTYGNSQGYLFYLNDKTMKTYVVKIKSKHRKMLAGRNIHKYFELTKDENNNFGFGATIRDKSGEEDYESGKYKVKKLKENEYILVDEKE